MPSFTLGRAARLYGLHRSTLYAAINRGCLSVGLDVKGQKVVDLSELIRVFGEPPPGGAASLDSSTPASTVHSTPPADALQPLLDELRFLRVEYQAGREENRLLREEVRELRETLLLLEHKPEREPRPEEPHASTTPNQGNDSEIGPGLSHDKVAGHKTKICSQIRQTSFSDLLKAFE